MGISPFREDQSISCNKVQWLLTIDLLTHWPPGDVVVMLKV